MTSAPTTTPVEPINILLVDDRVDNLIALSAILEQPGYNLVKATSGAEALRLVLKESYAVVLLDVMMPVMDGIEVALLIKSRERSKDMPIIFLTAAGMDMDRILKAYALGAVDYLVRPVQPEVVRAKVDVFVELYRKTEEVKRQAALLREHDRREREREVADLKSQHERRYRDLAESIPQMVWRAAPGGEATYFTQRWREHTGLSTEASLGWGWLSALHPDDSPRFRQQLLTAVQAGTRFQAECRIRRSDGAFAWYLCQALPDKEGEEVAGWLGAYTDIDAQKRGEEERAELLRKAQVARERAEEMQRRISVLAEVSRLASESLDINESLAKVTDLLVATICEGCVIELFDEDSRSSNAPTAISHRSASGEQRIQDRLLTAGAPVPEALRAALAIAGCLIVPLEARSGVVVGRITLLAPGGREWAEDEVEFAGDIGRRIALFVENARLYVKARRAIGARDEFLSVAAHELRTPLTALVIQVQTLARSLRRETRLPFSMDDAVRKIEAAERQLGRLTRLIEVLLDVSRIAAQKLQINPSEVDLTAIVRDVATKLSEMATQGGSAIELSLEGPVVGRWDALRIEQVVTNLVSNALKYGRGEPIEVFVQSDGNTAELVVRDRGIGIAPEHLPRIFDRFERAAPASSYGGLGLGLYITKQIVLAHGGSIDVTSEVGEGTELTVRLPLTR